MIWIQIKKKQEIFQIARFRTVANKKCMDSLPNKRDTLEHVIYIKIQVTHLSTAVS